MKRVFLAFLLLLASTFATAETISEQNPRGTLEATDLFECEDTTPSATYKCTLNEITVFIHTDAVDLNADGTIAAGAIDFNQEIVNDLGCTAFQSVRRNTGNTAWECADLGDMRKTTYDTDANSVVDEAEEVSDGTRQDIDVAGSAWTIEVDAVTAAKILNGTISFADVQGGTALGLGQDGYCWIYDHGTTSMVFANCATGSETDPTLTDDALVIIGDSTGSTQVLRFSGSTTADISYDPVNQKFIFGAPIETPADANPVITLIDSDFANTDDSFTIAVTQTSADNADVTLSVESGGVPVAFITVDADASGDGFITLPNNSIGWAEIANSLSCTANQSVRQNGTATGWECFTPGAGGGSGDVVGPASSTDNAVARYDGVTGKLLQNSGVTVADDGSLTVGGTGNLISGSASGITLDANTAQVTLGDDAGNNLSVSDAGVMSSNGTGGINLELTALINLLDHEIVLGDGVGPPVYTSIPDCKTNNMLTYDRTTRTFGCDADDGAGGGAPITVDYLVGTADATLSNEIVVGTTPGGDLGGTWAAPSVDDNSHNHTESNISNLTHTPDQVATVTLDNYCQGDAGSILSCDIATIPEADITFTTNDGSRHDHVEADISNLSHFSPNADPSVDHSSYVAGHGDGANCLAGQYPLGVDGSGAVQSCTDATTEIDSAIATHAAIVDSHFDHADNLTELNTQIGASLADGAHTADQVGTVTAGQYCQGDAGSILSCDIATIPEADVAFATNDGSRHDHVEADITNLGSYEEESQIGLTNVTGNAVDNATLIGTGANAMGYQTLPSCSDEAETLGYNTTTGQWVCNADAGAGGGMTSWTVQGDTGTASVSDGETVDIGGGDGLVSSVSTGSPEQVTIDVASQEAGFLEDGGVTSLTCGASNAGKMQVMDDGDLEWCDGAATPALKSVDGQVATHAAVVDAHFDHADNLTELNTQIGASLADGAHFSPNADPSVDHASYVAGHGNGLNCAAGSYPLGVDGSGAVESCTDATTEIDSAIATHAAIVDSHFDHADNLTELNTQIGASLADGAHTADQVGTVTDGQYCQGGIGGVLDCDQATIPEGSVAFNTNDGSRHDHVEADITNLAHFSPTAGISTDHGAGAITATTDLAGALCGTNQILEDQGASWACIDTPSGGGESTTVTDQVNGLDIALSTFDITIALDPSEVVQQAADLADLTLYEDVTDGGIHHMTFTQLQTLIDTTSVETAADITMGGDISSTANTAQVDDVQSATTNTEVANDNTTQVASTAFVQQEINNAGGTGLTCATGVCNVDLGTTVNLASGGGEITGTLEVGNGGTGQTLLTDGGLLYGQGVNGIGALNAASNGQIPIGDGTAAPTLATISPTANETEITNGAGSITVGLVPAPTVSAANMDSYPQNFSKTLFDSGGLADTDDITSIWRAPAALTVTEVWCETDTGTATITLEDGSGNDLATSCSCDNTGDTANTCTLTGNTAFTAGELLDFVMVTAAGNRLSFDVRYDLD